MSKVAPSFPSSRETRYEAHYGDRIVLSFAKRPADLNELFRRTAATLGDREAIIAGPRRLTYQEFDHAVENVAAGLEQCGLVKGDRVGLLLGNCAEFPIAMFGVLRAGMVAVPINTREQTAEILHKLTDCNARAVIFDATFAERVPSTVSAPDLVYRFVVGGKVAEALPLESLVGKTSRVVVQSEDPALILYTSGTTGRPKGATLTHLSMITGAMHYELCWELTCEDRAMMAVPVSHVTGVIAVLMTMVLVGGAVIFLPAFQAKDFVALAAAERMTYTIMVPAMYHLCLLQTEMSERELPHWRIAGYGGSLMPLSTIETLSKKFCNLRLVNAYGSTETSSPATLLPLNDGGRHRDTVGLPVPCCEIRIMDDEGREVPLGESGEIWIGGANVIPGYWNNAAANREAFVSGFWKSGDIGSFTADGYVQVLDRKKDMINRAGYKVYSAEVENVLTACPKVGEAAVIPVPDPILGERIHAYVFPTDKSVTAEEIKAHCRQFLSDYKVPDFVSFIDQPLPRNANGKILKRVLKGVT